MEQQKEKHEWPEVDHSLAAKWVDDMWAKTKDNRLLCDSAADVAWTLAQYHVHMQDEADVVFCKAITMEGLERFDALFEAIVTMYESQNYKGMDRLMDLALGTHSRGYVRTIMAAVRPVLSVVTKEKYDRLVEFLKKGNEERKEKGSITPP